MKFMEFKEKLVREFRVNGSICCIKDDLLLVNRYNTTWELDLALVYESKYLSKGFDVTEIYNILTMTFDNHRSLFSKPINWTKVYPVIRNIDFDVENLYFSEWSLDLRLYYVEDLGEHLRFIRNDDIGEENDIQELAFSNLEKISGTLKSLGEYEVYYPQFQDGFGGVKILSQNIKKQIEDIYGGNYIFIIPSDSGFIVAEDDKRGLQLLKSLLEEEDHEYRVSNNIYRYSEGAYSYADPSNFIKVIK